MATAKIVKFEKLLLVDGKLAELNCNTVAIVEALT